MQEFTYHYIQHLKQTENDFPTRFSTHFPMQ